MAWCVGGLLTALAPLSLFWHKFVLGCPIIGGLIIGLIVAVRLGDLRGLCVLGSTINPFATVIASNAASIPFTEGLILRLVLLLGGLVICAAYVMRYAHRVRTDPSRSVVAKQAEAHKKIFLQDKFGEETEAKLSGTQKVVLLIFAATFVVMIWGVSSQGWWMAFGMVL